MELTLTRTLQALTDPTRRKILEMLKDHDLTAGEIAAAFDISAPSVSHHLTSLKNAELVVSKRSGQHIVYSLNMTVLQEFLDELLHLFKVGEDKHA